MKRFQALAKLCRIPQSFSKNVIMVNCPNAVKIERGKITKFILFEISRVCVELSMEVAKIQKIIGESARRPRQEHPITLPENFLTADKVSRIVAGAPIKERYARNGTPMMLIKDRMMKIKPNITEIHCKSKFGFLSIRKY
ncbi:MAG: hypothetical protein L6461_02710 [Anaerolineae bacterium]|nr:hypothetical protein [Anaerolineae bacterium]